VKRQSSWRTVLTGVGSCGELSAGKRARSAFCLWCSTSCSRSRSCSVITGCFSSAPAIRHPDPGSVPPPVRCAAGGVTGEMGGAVALPFGVLGGFFMRRRAVAVKPGSSFALPRLRLAGGDLGVVARSP
jgi:hypothetical protein